MTTYQDLGPHNFCDAWYESLLLDYSGPARMWVSATWKLIVECMDRHVDIPVGDCAFRVEEVALTPSTVVTDNTPYLRFGRMTWKHARDGAWTTKYKSSEGKGSHFAECYLVVPRSRMEVSAVHALFLRVRNRSWESVRVGQEEGGADLDQNLFLAKCVNKGAPFASVDLLAIGHELRRLLPGSSLAIAEHRLAERFIEGGAENPMRYWWGQRDEVERSGGTYRVIVP